MTEPLHFHFSLSCIGEGNGNPLQCSCLENPRDGGAWWAAVYGIAQSRTRLKWLSSSNSSRMFKESTVPKIHLNLFLRKCAVLYIWKFKVNLIRKVYLSFIIFLFKVLLINIFKSRIGLENYHYVYKEWYYSDGSSNTWRVIVEDLIAARSQHHFISSALERKAEAECLLLL